MKVRVDRVVRAAQIINLSPEEYCAFYAHMDKLKNILPKVENATSDIISDISLPLKSDKDELDCYLDLVINSR